jgi:adenylate cyclase
MSPIEEPEGRRLSVRTDAQQWIGRLLRRDPDVGTLPDAIRRRIAERDWASERLLRGIQLLIIVFFGALYTVSPKTFEAGSLSPTPFVLAAYFVLAVFGLVWGYLREPPDWASYVSIVFDFALLYGLIISFHHQYGQPATFLLKAPALLYVFIFISLRALRFDPKFVVFAGLVAAAGWVAVIVYVRQVDSEEFVLTRSYVEYLTSNALLIGAEVDKIMSMLAVTAVLAMAVNGSRSLLITAVSEEAAATGLSRFFDPGIARAIRAGGHQSVPGTAQREEAAILNLDIRGFSRIAEHCEPEIVMRILAAYQGRVIPIVHARNGVVDKFLGDGIMVTFGVGAHSSSYAADAIDCAEAVLADLRGWADLPEMQALGRPLAIGIGISSGTVSWGVVGRDDRLELTVIGPAVNLSAKIEKCNKAFGSACMVDAETWRLAQAQGYRGSFQARPVEAPIEGSDRRIRAMILTLP